MLKRKQLSLDRLGLRDGHEEHIARLFGGRMAYDGTLPCCPQPLAIMAFTNRAGSHLLAEYLRQTARMAGFGEALNHETVADGAAKWSCQSLPDYIARLVAHQTPQGGRWWGVKASPEQMMMLLRANVPAMFPGLRVIHVWRRNILAQAVSLDIAYQTGRWTSLQKPQGKAVPRFDIQRIERTINALQAANAAILALTSAFALPTVSVCYEDLLARPRALIHALGAQIGLNLSHWRPEPPKLTRQADATNVRFIAEFRQRAREALGRW